MMLFSPQKFVPLPHRYQMKNIQFAIVLLWLSLYFSCSGLFIINRITTQQVEDLVRILPIPEPGEGKPIPAFDADEIATQYNQNLRFAPDDPRLCYSIREQICVGVWPIPKDFKARRFVNSLFVKSSCIDANLVIDGSISYPFNDGAKALLEVHPEDALLTISLD